MSVKWIVGLGVVGLVGAGAFLWFFILGGADDPVTLEDAVAAVTTQAPGTATAADEVATTEDTGAATAAAPGDLDGTWTVAEGLDSFVGYRAQEELDPIGKSTATGRTRAVTGRLVIDGATITEVFVDADVGQLESDRSSRDRALRSRGLETSRFPQATFELTEAIELDSDPVEGELVVTAAGGDLTAHGVTRPVVARLEAQLVEGVIAAVGSIEVKLSDFEISGLTGFAVLAVEDDAVVEFQLLFSR